MLDNHIGTYVCQSHYEKLDREYEQFSISPIFGQRCDFCKNSAKHWLTIKPIEIKFLEEKIDDGFGNSVSIICSKCHRKSMFVLRPGDFRCYYCD
jgi:hypothetical protein